MTPNIHSRLAKALSRSIAIAALASLSVAAQAQPAGIAPEASQILKASTDFLASQQRFSADTRNTLEIVLKSGQKIEFNSTAPAIRAAAKQASRGTHRRSRGAGVRL